MPRIIPDKESALSLLSSSQITELEMHSFINVVNVISSLIEMLQMDQPDDRSLAAVMEDTRRLLKEVRNGSVNIMVPDRFSTYKNHVRSILKTLEEKTSHSLETDGNETAAGDSATEDGDLKQALENIRDAGELLEKTFDVLDTRLEEFSRRLSDNDEWMEMHLDSFRNEYKSYFQTQESNSRGRFRIVMNGTRADAKDYLVLTNFTSDHGGKLIMPVLFKDVIRDLVSNARKYTPPGGTLHFEVRLEDNRLHFLISDTGIGIPEDELAQVFEFGYRASNAKSIRTMGGGFGLTKALHVVGMFDGELWIESSPDNGTTISIELPLPENFRETKGDERRGRVDEKEI